MRKKLTILIITIVSIGFAQSITNKLGGTSESETYDITDSNDNVLLRVEGNGEVGIGTNTPDANLDIHGTVQAFGAYEEKAFDTLYQATTDGFVVAYCYTSVTGHNWAQLKGFTDASSTPTTLIAYDFQYNYDMPAGAGISMPIRKGDYWEVERLGGDVMNRVSWIPLGQ